MHVTAMQLTSPKAESTPPRIRLPQSEHLTALELLLRSRGKTCLGKSRKR